VPDDLILPGIQLADAIIHLPGGRTHHIRDRREIPAQLVHLDVDEHGVAIPWVGRDGADEAKVAARIRRVIVDGLCGVCGFDLAYWKCWHVQAGNAVAARACRYMTGAPMHVEACSPYAEAAYPGPGQWWRYVARSYTVARDLTGTKLAAHVGAPKRVEALDLG
jgi:hypothetical protein